MPDDLAALVRQMNGTLFQWQLCNFLNLSGGCMKCRGRKKFNTLIHSNPLEKKWQIKIEKTRKCRSVVMEENLLSFMALFT